MTKDEHASFLLPLAIAAVVVLVLFAGAWVFIAVSSFDGFEDAGQFGDAFGWVNALFSGLALAAVAVTLLLQSKELQEQRKEMEKQARIQAVTAQAQCLSLRAQKVRDLTNMPPFVADPALGGDVEILWKRINDLVDELELGAAPSRPDSEPRAVPSRQDSEPRAAPGPPDSWHIGQEAVGEEDYGPTMAYFYWKDAAGHIVSGKTYTLESLEDEIDRLGSKAPAEFSAVLGLLRHPRRG